jgi:superfamily II DNA/RNA helicase
MQRQVPERRSRSRCPSYRSFLLTHTVYLPLCSHRRGTVPSLLSRANCSDDHRELAFQISEQFVVLGSPLNIRTAVIVGGMDMMTQAIELTNRPHVVVATPGRIVDHLRSSSAEWDLSRVKFLVRAYLSATRLRLVFIDFQVLDEADRLLSPSFAEDLAYLFGVLPKDRQTALFTATWTPSIDKIADATPKPGKQKLFIHKITSAYVINSVIGRPQSSSRCFKG